MTACDSKRFDRAAPGAECIGYDRERCVGNDVYRCDDTSGKRSVMGLLTGKGAHWVLRPPCPPATSRCVEATDASGLEVAVCAAVPVTRCDPAAPDEREVAGGSVLRCDLAGYVVSDP